MIIDRVSILSIEDSSLSSWYHSQRFLFWVSSSKALILHS